MWQIHTRSRWRSLSKRSIPFGESFDLLFGRARAVISSALEGSIAAGEPVYISAISLIEICYLIEKRRIATDLLQRIQAVLNDPNPSLVVVPIDLAISIAIREIDRDTVPDMPDRIIAATALYLNLPLVTRDRKIRAEGAIVTIW